MGVLAVRSGGFIGAKTPHAVFAQYLVRQALCQQPVQRAVQGNAVDFVMCVKRTFNVVMGNGGVLRQQKGKHPNPGQRQAGAGSADQNFGACMQGGGVHAEIVKLKHRLCNQVAL